jgi:NAD(P)-dependent dehydrogenase (short-subunit alcohol dehydrogenase family)
MNVLVTGGASGLGEAITKLLAAEGKNVFFTYCNSSDSAERITKEFANTTAIRCDFRLPEDVSNLCTKVKELDLDVLVNNYYVGEAVKNHFNKISADDFLTDFKYNVLPVVQLSQAAIDHFRKKRSGKIVTVLTSFLLNSPPIGTSVYVANKAYLEKLTKVWANENAKYNISSNSVSPSFMLTGLNKDVDERIVEQVRENNPYKKILTTEEAAEAVGFLINATKQINGIDLVINGGKDLR